MNKLVLYNTPLLPLHGIGERYDIAKPYQIYVKQRSYADVNFPISVELTQWALYYQSLYFEVDGLWKGGARVSEGGSQIVEGVQGYSVNHIV